MLSLLIGFLELFCNGKSIKKQSGSENFWYQRIKVASGFVLKQTIQRYHERCWSYPTFYLSRAWRETQNVGRYGIFPVRDLRRTKDDFTRVRLHKGTSDLTGDSKRGFKGFFHPEIASSQNFGTASYHSTPAIPWTIK